MIAVGVNEIYQYSTGNTAFLTSLTLTFAVGTLLVLFVWRFTTGKRIKN
ncbi:hypothetical protein [Gibbsiella quercinecans]|nr:hypothetical protein [Gibbsiella quercinecans]